MGLTAKWRRRKPGIYLVRTRKHGSMLRENGYVGLSNHVHLRRLDHLGRGRHNHPAKPWADLDPAWHVLPLPWWLGFYWVMAPLETLAIALTWPRYNHAKNLWNPRRVPLSQQAHQRIQREAGRVVVRTRARVRTFQFAGVLLIVAGLAWMIL